MIYCDIISSCLLTWVGALSAQPGNTMRGRRLGLVLRCHVSINSRIHGNYRIITVIIGRVKAPEEIAVGRHRHCDTICGLFPLIHQADDIKRGIRVCPYG